MSAAETCRRCGRDLLHMPDNGNYCCCVRHVAAESIPSGALKVAEECKRLLIRARNAAFDCGKWTSEDVDAPLYAPVLKASQDARAEALAAIDQLAALASPSPATGALREPLKVKMGVGKVLARLRAAIAATPECRERLGGQSFAYLKKGDMLDLLDAFYFVETAHGITVASKVEPEDNHG